MSTIEAKTDTYNLEQITLVNMAPVNPGLFLKITGTGTHKFDFSFL